MSAATESEETGAATSEVTMGPTSGGSGPTSGPTTGAATAGSGPTSESASMTDGATETGGAPGPDEACAAWCAYNVMCSDIPPEYCAMTCAMDFAEAIGPGACQDAYVAFYLCVGGVSSCAEGDLEAACGDLLTATETSCGG